MRWSLHVAVNLLHLLATAAQAYALTVGTGAWLHYDDCEVAFGADEHVTDMRAFVYTLLHLLTFTYCHFSVSSVLDAGG